MIAWAQMGDANASIPTPQPVLPRPMFGAVRRGRGSDQPRRSSRQAALDDGLAERLGLARRLVAVGRHASRQGRPAGERRDAAIEVDPDTFAVRIDGELIEEQPATELPMAQRYFLF